MKFLPPLLATAVALTAVGPIRSEVIEEIVAHVDSDIITKSDFEDEEETLIAEAYRQLAGEELDRVLEEKRAGLLMSMIDRKILLHRAMRLYDVNRMGDVYYDSFKRQQGMESDAEFEAALANQGMTVEELKSELVEMFAPDDVLRIEVGGRVAVGDPAVDDFYAEHPERFKVDGEVTIREIVLLADTDRKKDDRRDELKAVMERLAEEDFATVAKEVSEAGTKDEGGLLGPLVRSDLAWQLQELAFKQEVGEVGVVETPYGFHVIEVEERTEDSILPLEEVRERIRTYLENETYLKKLNEFMEKARKESDWCVKDKYMHRLPEEMPSKPCASL
jgi:parvulin-like peptidyl-prolyl isomerase